jgi:hypothetical protein
MTFISPEQRSGGLPQRVEQPIEQDSELDTIDKSVIEKLPKNYTKEEDKNAKSS